MTLLFRFFLACSLLAGPTGLGQNQSTPLSPVELIKSPKKYDRKLVTVQGAVHIESEKPNGFVVAYLLEDDAKQASTSNSILIVPSKQMLRDREKINGTSVALTASFRATLAANGGYIPELKDIESCIIRPNRSTD
jgi:hypothetical protein